MTAQRRDAGTAIWPLRPWLMAGVCAVAGLLLWWLGQAVTPATQGSWNLPAMTFVAIAAVSFVITVERTRWSWSIAFAAEWGAVIAFVGWFTVRYNLNPTIFEWPFLSSVFAVLIAAPLFQTVRDEGAWRFPYDRLHSHAWADAVIGVAALVFVGIAFLLTWLISGLFKLIGIRLVSELLNSPAFDWALAGFAFGGAIGLLRERDALVATLQRLVMVVMSVLAPVLAGALLLFLASLPFTGLGILWSSSLSTTPLMLTSAAGAVLLANAVIGNGRDDRATNRVLWWSAMALAMAVLPLAIIAALSMGARIGQYGWTPERIWGAVAVGVALAYGVAGWGAAIRGRGAFDEMLRPLQTRLALAVCGLAVLLALPLIDFGAISTRSQMARLASGRITAEKFDWRAIAFAFGPAGRARLADIARTGPTEQRKLAAMALAAKDRYAPEFDVERTRSVSAANGLLRVVPVGRALPPALKAAITGSPFCRGTPCVVTWIDERRVVIAGGGGPGMSIMSGHYQLDATGAWNEDYDLQRANVRPSEPAPIPDMATVPVELRTVERKQLFVDGKPVGDAFP